MPKDVIIDNAPPSFVYKKESFEPKPEDVTVLYVMAQINLGELIIDAAKKLRARKYPREKCLYALYNCYKNLSLVEIEGYFDLA